MRSNLGIIASGYSGLGAVANPSYQQGQNAAIAASRSPSVTFSAGVATDDIVYFFCSTTVTPSAITTPAGWVNVLGGNTTVDSDAHMCCGVYHVVTAGESGSTTFTCTNLFNANATGNVLAAVIRNVKTTDPLDYAGSSFNINAVTPFVLAAITGTGGALSANSLVVYGVAKDGTGTYTAPGGTTQRQTSNSTLGTWMGTRDALTTANTNVAAINITPSASDEYASISVAFANTAAPDPAPLLSYSFAESGTTATDRSGNGRTATMYSGATPTDLHSSGAFAPTASTHRLVYDATSDSAALPTTGCSITVKFTTGTLSTGGGEIFSKMRISDSSSFNLYIEGTALNAVVRGTAAAVLVHSGLTSSTTYTAAVTYDGVTSRLYVNGALSQTSVAANGALDMSGDLSWQSGDHPLSTIAFAANYTVDDVRLFGHALNATEVAAFASTPVT